MSHSSHQNLKMEEDRNQFEILMKTNIWNRYLKNYRSIGSVKKINVDLENFAVGMKDGKCRFRVCVTERLVCRSLLSKVRDELIPRNLSADMSAYSSRKLESLLRVGFPTKRYCVKIEGLKSSVYFCGESNFLKRTKLAKREVCRALEELYAELPEKQKVIDDKKDSEEEEEEEPKNVVDPDIRKFFLRSFFPKIVFEKEGKRGNWMETQIFRKPQKVPIHELGRPIRAGDVISISRLGGQVGTSLDYCHLVLVVDPNYDEGILESTVIHYVGRISEEFRIDENGKKKVVFRVKKETLRKAIGKKKVKDLKLRRGALFVHVYPKTFELDPRLSIKIAESFLGGKKFLGKDYNTFGNSCDTFTTFCKTGWPGSLQAWEGVGGGVDIFSKAVYTIVRLLGDTLRIGSGFLPGLISTIEVSSGAAGELLELRHMAKPVVFLGRLVSRGIPIVHLIGDLFNLLTLGFEVIKMIVIALKNGTRGKTLMQQIKHFIEDNIDSISKIVPIALCFCVTLVAAGMAIVAVFCPPVAGIILLVVSSLFSMFCLPVGAFLSRICRTILMVIGRSLFGMFKHQRCDLIPLLPSKFNIQLFHEKPVECLVSIYHKKIENDLKKEMKKGLNVVVVCKNSACSEHQSMEVHSFGICKKMKGIDIIGYFRGKHGKCKGCKGKRKVIKIGFKNCCYQLSDSKIKNKMRVKRVVLKSISEIFSEVDDFSFSEIDTEVISSKRRVIR